MSSLLSVSGFTDRRIVVGGRLSLELLAGDLAPEQAGDRQHGGPNPGLGRPVVVGGNAVRRPSPPVSSHSALPPRNTVPLGGEVREEQENVKKHVLYYQCVRSYSGLSVSAQRGRLAVHGTTKIFSCALLRSMFRVISTAGNHVNAHGFLSLSALRMVWRRSCGQLRRLALSAISWQEAISAAKGSASSSNSPSLTMRA